MSLKNMMGRHSFMPNPDDFVFVVMGPTGSGKSNFINALTGNAEQKRAGDLRSHTQDVVPHAITRGSDRFVFVDTPGFDDTYRPDTDILMTVSKWLTQKYANDTTLNVTGIIYLHRITDNRLPGSVYKNLQMFGKLCGNIPLRRARLVTTMWDKIKDPAVGESRENQLRDDFWRLLLDGGAKSVRSNNTSKGAWDIVGELGGLGKEGEELLLQEEILKDHKHVNETEAGKVLYSRFQQLLSEQKKTLRDLADEAKLANDPALAKSLQEEYEKVNAQLQATFEQMNAMKIPLTRRIRLWLAFRKSRGQAVNV